MAPALADNLGQRWLLIASFLQGPFAFIIFDVSGGETAARVIAARDPKVCLAQEHAAAETGSSRHRPGLQWHL